MAGRSHVQIQDTIPTLVWRDWKNKYEESRRV